MNLLCYTYLTLDKVCATWVFYQVNILKSRMMILTVSIFAGFNMTVYEQYDR